jgi:endoglucanase
MNNHKQAHTPPRRTLLRSFVSLFTLSLGLAATAQATTYYQVVNQGSGDWTNTTAWNSASDGSGTAPTAINNTDDFICNNSLFSSWVLRTPTSAATFGGKSLTLGPAINQLLIKGGVNTITVPNLITLGSPNITSGSNNSVLTVSAFLNSSVSTRLGNNGATNALYTLTIGALTGSGNFELTGTATSTLKLTVTDAVDYLGTFTLTSGKLEFMNAMSSAGGLVVATPGNVTLNHAVTFTSLTVNGVSYAAGQTYSAASLGFLGNGSGSVTVRTPATWYLTVNQAGTQNWTEAYLSNWNSSAAGGGIAPPSINLFDNYINQGAARELRTPGTASTFGGGSLTLASTAKLTVKTGANVVSTIPVFITTGTPSIANGGGNYRQNVALGDWDITSGSTKLSASAGRSLGFAVDYLTGAGGLQTQSGGAFYLSVNHGSDYTGTIDHASGSLRFENYVGTSGSLNVGSGATVYLDQHVYFTGLTINGIVKSPGFYDYATLTASHNAQFPTGASTGLIGVYTPGPAPVRMNGVNLSGLENGSVIPGTLNTNYICPTAADFDYYHAKGLNLIRLPFKWERVQTSFTGSLNSTYLGYMDGAIALAAARGMKVIIDMHNYAQYSTPSGTLTFGQTALPASYYADAWRKLADHYKNNAAIYGYDLMNEPHGLGSGVWLTYAQSAINAIREVDMTHDIIVEGEYWANAKDFATKNPQLHTLNDPINRLIFSAHSYFNKNLDGNYGTYDAENGAPDMGVKNVKYFIDWLKKYNFRGFVGEYGIPNDGDLRWNTVMNNFLAYLTAEGVSGTYWASSPWYTSNLNCLPLSNYTVDKPQMSSLQNYP